MTYTLNYKVQSQYIPCALHAPTYYSFNDFFMALFQVDSSCWTSQLCRILFGDQNFENRVCKFHVKVNASGSR